MQQMALQWRTASVNGGPVSARLPHAGRPASRGVVRVRASIVNPHSILGVSPTADVKEVKRAYRKLALQYHPDVCKSEDGHQRFMALTQAYEMLLGRAEGKTDPNHASASGWDFHDWYWNFRMQRSWEKQQRQAKAAAAAAAAAEGGDADSFSGDYGCDGGLGSEPGGCGRRPPPHAHAGYKQPEARDNLRSQLAGLRHRAAVRAHRQTSTPATGPSTAPAQQHQQPRPQQQSQQPQPTDSWSWTWSWDDTLECSDDESAPPTAATSAPAVTPAAVVKGAGGGATASRAATGAAAAAGLHHQYTHVYDSHGAGRAGERMAVHDGHLGTVVANHAVPFPGCSSSNAAAAAAAATSAAHTAAQHRTQQQQPQSVVQQSTEEDYSYSRMTAAANAADPGMELMAAAASYSAASGADSEPEPEPFSNPFDAAGPAHQQARRRFSGDSATREAVSHQLTGLRRKAAIKRQWGPTGSGSGSGSDA